MNTNVDQRAAWLKERQSVSGVGASESAALFNLHPHMSAFSLFEKLTNPRSPTEEEIEEDADVRSFGLAIEPYLADWYARKTGRTVSKPPIPLYRLKEKPFIFSTPDCLYHVDQNENDLETFGPLELKASLFFDPVDPIPDHWQIQVQQQMLCVEAFSASFAILGGFRRRYHVDDIPYNPAFGSILVETIERFMAAVQAGSWAKWGGEIEGSKATAEAIKRLYKNETGATVQLGGDVCAWADDLAKAKADIRNAEDRELTAQNRIRMAIGDATFAELSDGRTFSLKTQERAAYQAKASKFRVLRMFEQKGKR